ncbi:efflux RND transporter permease subunit [Zoogloea sp.]|uniref:efflux RND transporter permease subunit n=1 Tax=Zoogloea sp. TaxID=49181 RepID=UPI001416E1D9|nr:MAG: efflux RND transporter permease subunit [Zoogloea sp.]
MSILSKLLQRPVAMSMFYLMLIVSGIYAFLRLPLELAPQIEYPNLSVSTNWGHTSPETMEAHISAPIESIANSVQGVRNVSSVSGEGESRVDIEFDQNVDMDYARFELKEKILSFSETLPSEVPIPEIKHYLPEDIKNLQGFLSFSLFGNYSKHELTRIAKEVFVPALLSIKGVASVQVYGGVEKNISIEIDSNRAELLGINSEIIWSKIKANVFNGNVGSIIEGNSRNIISIKDNASNVAQFKDINVSSDGNLTPIYLKDVANISENVEEPSNLYRVNGKPSVSIVIDREANTNTLNVAKSVLKKTLELHERLPKELSLLKISDKSEYLIRELNKLFLEVLFSFGCIFLLLLFFLRNVQSSVLVLSSILFSLAGTFFFFWVFGIGLNLFTMAGLILGFGRLVDDSIVVLDNISRKLIFTYGEKQNAILTGFREIALPVIASTLATVGALTPMGFLPIELKPYFLQFSYAIGISLIMSLLVSFTLIPLMLTKINLNQKESNNSLKVKKIGVKVYHWLLLFVLKRKGIALFIIIWFFGFPVWLLPDKINTSGELSSFYNKTIGSDWYQSVRPLINYCFGGTSFLFFSKVPKGEIWDIDPDTYLIVRIQFPQGTQIEQYDSIVKEIENRTVFDTIHIAKVTSKISKESGVIRIDINKQYADSNFPIKLRNDLILFGAQTGGAKVFIYGYGPGYNNTGDILPIFEINVEGYNYNTVKSICEQIRGKLEQNSRVSDIDINGSFGKWDSYQEIVVDIDRDATNRYGLTIGDVVEAIKSIANSEVVYGTIPFGDKHLKLVIRNKEGENLSIYDLDNYLIFNKNGKPVRLKNIIHVFVQKSPGEIYRQDQQYIRSISFEYKGPYKFGAKYTDGVIKSMQLPHGYSVYRKLPEVFLSDENRNALLLIALFSCVIVFMVTASLYESYLNPTIIILAIPFSLIGLFAAFYFSGEPFGRGGYAAIILLIGIVVSNSIVLLDGLTVKYVQNGYSVSNLIEVCTHRLRPIMMTSGATVIGMIPLLFEDRSSIWYQLSIGAIGGMLSSTILVLVILPLVFSMFYGKK